MTKTRPLIPYLRQSRKKNERTISIDEQRRVIVAWAKANGIRLAPEVVEQNVSGSKDWRDRELGAAIIACERGEVGGIIVAWQDRLSRENGRATAEVWEALDRAGARLVAAGEGLDTATGDHEMLFTIKAAIAREQWKRYAQQFEDAKQSAVDRGLHVGPAPVGYVRHRRGEPLTLDGATYRAVRAAFKLRATGAPYGDVLRLLDEKIPGGPSGSGAWNRNTVTRLLKNPVYLGEARGGDGYVKKNAHPAIVTQDVFDIVQALARRGDRSAAVGNGARSLLAGVARCGSCGYALDRNKVAKHYIVYRCRGRSATGLCEAPTSVMADALDDFVWKAVIERLRSRVGKRKAVEVDVSDIHARITKAREKRELFEDPDYAAALGKDKALPALRRINDELATLDEELADAVGSTGAEAEAEEFFGDEAAATLTTDEKREVMQKYGMVEMVVVSRGRSKRAPLAERTEIYWKGDDLPFDRPTRGRRRNGHELEAGVTAA